MVRLAYICSDSTVPVFGTGGRSIHIQEMLRAWKRNGVQVELFAGHLGGDRPKGLEEIHIHKLSLFGGDLGPDERAVEQANQELSAMLRKNKQGPFDMAYERYSLWSYAGMEYSRTYGIPGILEVSESSIEKLEGRFQSAKKLAEKTLNAASTLLAGSKKVSDYLRNYSKVFVEIMPGGLSPDRFLPSDILAAYRHSRDTFTVGFFGDLRRWRELSLLVEAFAILHRQHPKCRLLIVGEGSKRTRLISELSRKGLLGTASFSGFVPDHRLSKLLASMDVAIAPNMNGKSVPIVYEYMTAGLPVVVPETEQTVPLIEDQTNGLLCESGNAHALAAALQRLYEDSSLRERLGNAARSTVVNEHAWDRLATRILELVSVQKNQPAA